MPSLYENIRDRARKRALYARTVASLRATSAKTRQDLDFGWNDIPRIARESVYEA